MTYNAALAAKVRNALPADADVVEKKMFGGIVFMLDGNMAVGVDATDLMVRVGPDAYEAALKLPHARLMDITGRPLKGFVLVSHAGTRTANAVAAWVDRAVAFVRTLPAKAATTKRPARTRTMKKPARTKRPTSVSSRSRDRRRK